MHTCEKQKVSYVRDPERFFREGDYAYARTRALRLKRGDHPGRGYKTAMHFAEVIATRNRSAAQSTPEESFNEQAERWKNETGHLSSITKAIVHPSYLRIIGMGKQAIPLLLKELQERPDHWLVALNAITGEDPAPEDATFMEAVAAWIHWGRSKKLC